MTSAYCASCDRIHSLPSTEAENYAKSLIQKLDATNSILSSRLLDFTGEKWPLFYFNSKLYRRMSMAEWKEKCSVDYLWGPARGKMFGICVCQDNYGNTRILKAFSGQYNGLWEIPGWAPPLFGVDAFNRLSAPADAAIKRLDKKIAVLPKGCGEYVSRTEKRKAISQKLMTDLHRIYEVHTFNSPKISSLENIFYRKSKNRGPKGMPTGTGDCCAPKLLNYAAQLGLKPRSLGEFYYGKENRSGSRRHLQFYDNCSDKCGPILGRMLCGSADYADYADYADLQLRVVAEFKQYVVINKPSGLPSVSGTSAETQDSVSTRFIQLFAGELDPQLQQPVIHRLDMDTSGIMILAKTAEAHRRLSILFQNRLMYKEYIAELSSPPACESGIIDMPLARSMENPLVQVPALSGNSTCNATGALSSGDALFSGNASGTGKQAITRWHFCNQDNRTRIIFMPQTGRTHQLRAHAAYALHAPIKGDRIYGSESKAGKLRLHASNLSFLDPFTGESMEFTSQPNW